MMPSRPAFASLFLLTVVFIGPSASSSPAQSACSLSGQLPDTAQFDPSQVHFVSGSVPTARLSFQTISRVIDLNPIVFETLDTNLDDRTAIPMCGPISIRSVDARLRLLLPQLRVGDLVKTTMTVAQEEPAKLILQKLDNIAGPPAYFHPRAEASVCPNRTSTLAAFDQPSGERLIVHNDGSISYLDAHFHLFKTQRLDAAGLTHLFQAFHSTNFNTLPGEPPETARSQASITLNCYRFQRVLVPGRESGIVPLIQALDQVTAKALSQTDYLLTYVEKRPATFLEWHFAGLPLENFEGFKQAASNDMLAATREKRQPLAMYAPLGQAVPAAFLAKLPCADPRWCSPQNANTEVYCKSGDRIFRVEHPPIADASDRTFLSLTVHEVLAPQAALTRLELARQRRRRCCSARDSQATATSEITYATACTQLMGVHGGLLWPADVATELRSIPASGQLISQSDYSRHESLYRELLAAGNCGDGLGIDFVEGGFVYKSVRLIPVDR